MCLSFEPSDEPPTTTSSCTNQDTLALSDFPSRIILLEEQNDRETGSDSRSSADHQRIHDPMIRRREDHHTIRTRGATQQEIPVHKLRR